MDVSSSISVMMAIENQVSHHLPSAKDERRFFLRNSQMKNPMTIALRAMSMKGFIALFYENKGKIIQACRAELAKGMPGFFLNFRLISLRAVRRLYQNENGPFIMIR